jgi:hypothetical protein
MIERVVIDKEGKIRLELRTPFSYLREISDQVCGSSVEVENDVSDPSKMKTGESDFAGSPEAECSDQLLCCGRDRIRTCDPTLLG